MAPFSAVVPGPSGLPSTSTSPPSRARTPQIMEMVVVLPAPFGPSRPYVSPGAIWKPTPSTAARSPNRLRRSVATRTGLAVGMGAERGAGATGASRTAGLMGTWLPRQAARVECLSARRGQGHPQGHDAPLRPMRSPASAAQDVSVALAGRLPRTAPATRTLNPAAHLRGVLLVLGAALGFATLGPLSGIAYRAGMGSPTFVTLRAVVGATLLALVVLRDPTLRVPLRGLLRREQLLLGTAVVANACLNLALFAAYGQMAVALVLAVYFTYPMLVALGSVAIGRERFTLTRSAGLLLAGIGLALVMADQVGGAGSSVPLLGLAFALAAATCQASYLVVSRAGYTRVPAEQATALMLAGGALLAGVVALAADLPAR